MYAIRSYYEHLSSQELTEDLLTSYIHAYQNITIVPKKMMGSSPVRLTAEAVELIVHD